MAETTENPKERLEKVIFLAESLNKVQKSMASLDINGDKEFEYYTKKVKPLMEDFHTLTLAINLTALGASNLQSNSHASKKQIKLALSLSYEVSKEAYCMLELIKRRNSIYRHMVEDDIKKSGCENGSSYKSSFCDLDEDCYEELNEYYNKKYCHKE